MDPTKSTTDNSQDYSIVVRFGSAVLEAGHTSIPNLVLRHYAELKVTTGELVFMTLCLQLKWSKGNPHPSLATIADRMGVSRRQVRTYAAGLRAKGLLNVEERVDPGRGQLSSVYDFTPFLEAVVRLDGGDVTPPGKDSSEGGRKNPSEDPGKDSSALKEDEEQEDKVMQSSRLLTFGRRTAPVPAMPARTHTAVVEHHAQEPREPVSLADIVRSLPRPSAADRPTSAVPKAAPSKYAERPYLDSLIRGISQIFNDDENTEANVIRAHRLQERAGLDEDTFTQCVFRARSLVKERRIRHRGAAVRRPGAYFFTILEDLANEASGQNLAQNRSSTPSKMSSASTGHFRAKRSF